MRLFLLIGGNVSQTHEKLCLYFSQDFCESQHQGHYYELDPNSGADTTPRTKWLIGRMTGQVSSVACDVILTNRIFSRIHCTILYDWSIGRWWLLDGGIYPGEDLVTPSRNGVWVNRKRVPTGDLPRGGVQLEPGDFIQLSKALPSEIKVLASDKDTIGGDHSEDDEPDRHHYPTTQWDVIQDIVDWFQSPFTGPGDVFRRGVILLVVIVVVAIAIYLLK